MADAIPLEMEGESSEQQTLHNSNGEDASHVNLPDGWTKHRTDDGKEYYQDHNTKTTHWEIPKEAYNYNKNDKRKRRKIIIAIVVLTLFALIICLYYILDDDEECPYDGYYRRSEYGTILSRYDEYEICGYEIKQINFANFSMGSPMPITSTMSIDSTMYWECKDQCESYGEQYGDPVDDSYFYLFDTFQCYCCLCCGCSRVERECLDLTNNGNNRGEMYVWTIELDNSEDSECVGERRNTYGGRPYNIVTQSDLKSNLKYIDCNEYDYFYKDLLSLNTVNFSIYDQQMWTKRALSEYASIGTFYKFSLQLMSIAAPLWMLQLSNQAGLDEIKHTQISFDILNMYNMNKLESCIIYDRFPIHTFDIIGNDWNEISKDTAIGGCIGETISALSMIKQGRETYDNIVHDIVIEIANDEVRHAALAWIAVKWMIDNVVAEIGI